MCSTDLRGGSPSSCPHLQALPGSPPASCLRDAHSPPPPTSADSPLPTRVSVFEALLSFVPFGLPFSWPWDPQSKSLALPYPYCSGDSEGTEG